MDSTSNNSEKWLNVQRRLSPRTQKRQNRAAGKTAISVFYQDSEKSQPSLNFDQI
jgi:hypothetical protein